jgi:hypothetical protein
MSEKQSEVETVKALFGSKYFQRNCKVPFPLGKTVVAAFGLRFHFLRG